MRILPALRMRNMSKDQAKERIRCFNNVEEIRVKKIFLTAESVESSGDFVMNAIIRIEAESYDIGNIGNNTVKNVVN